MEKHHHPHIPMTAVTSSQIAAIGHDPATNTLRVQFKGSGSVYDYANVPADVHQAFGKAESLGKFLGSHIKGKYEFKKLAQPAPAKA
jgi:hypothetical protein